jgi:hypothetical protein
MAADGATVVLLLLRDQVCAQRVVELLRATSERGTGPCTVLVPPVGGVEFFSEPAAQPELDRWWGPFATFSSEPVFIVEHEPGLDEWLRGLDGMFVVGACPSSAVDEYDLARVRTLSTAAPGDYARAVDELLGRSALAAVPSTSAALLRFPVSAPDGPTNHIAPVDAGVPSMPDPFSLLASMHTDAEPQSRSATAAPPPYARASQRPPRSRLGTWLRRNPAGTDQRRLGDRELAEALVGRGATIVAVGSRKGGVGKTSHAAGMAIVAGGLLDGLGQRAAIVDGNIANPDAWGQLDLPGGAATVRDVVDALINNREPPKPVHASTPALACYPEQRATSEYSRTEIVRFAQHLRERHAFVVIDLSNRLPDPLAGPEAAAAAYWLEQADCLVLPTASSKQDFNGALDYLELPDLPPAVVAYLRPVARRNREHPLTKRYLAAIAHRAVRVVDLPDQAEEVRYAGMEGLPVQAVSPALGAAYRDLVQAVAGLPKRRGT